MKPVLYALAALTLVAACQRREEAEAPDATPMTGAAETPANQAAPLTYSRETAYAEVQLTLPPEIVAYPDLHAAIYGEEVRGLREFLEGAQSVHTEYGGEGMPPYEQTITYEPAGESARLFSLRETSSEYTGGAHGMYGFSGVLAPSQTPGRAGGLEFLIGPYIVGPFAEGAYQIVVPQTAFRGLLNPAFAGEFAGAPREVGDVTPREPVTQAR